MLTQVSVKNRREPGAPGYGGSVLFKVFEIFQEEQPGGLLGVVEFGGASGFFAEDVVDVFEGLFEHGVFVRSN